MEIKRITVSAGRTFNHPHEQYSNLKPFITLEADLEPGEDAVKAAKDLQRAAEQLVEDHKQNLLQSIEAAHEAGEAMERMKGLASSLADAQRELDTLRKQFPQAAALIGAGETTTTPAES